MKFLEVFRFEIGYQLRRPAPWIYFLTLCGILLLVIAEVADYARTAEHVVLNSPLMLAEFTGYANKFGVFLIAVLVADAAVRDIHSRMDALVFTTSLKKSTYLGARSTAAFFLGLLMLTLAVPLSLSVAHLALDPDPSFFGEFNVSAYVHPILFITIPNILVAGLILYAMVLLSRQAMAAFAGAIVLLVLSTFTMEISGGNWALAKLLDPSGITVVNGVSDSLSPVQKVSAPLQLTGYLLANRILWLLIGAMVGALAFIRFRMGHHLQDTRTVFYRKRRSVSTDSTNVVRPSMGPLTLKVPASLNKSFRSPWSKLTQVGLLVSRFIPEVVGRPPGLMIPFLALYTFILIPNMAGGPLDVPILPATERIILFLNNAALEIFVAMLISLVAGQLIWRERDARLNEIADAVPASDLVLIVSKYLALAFILFILTCVLVISGIVIQLASGYSDLDIWLFVRMVMGVQLMDFLLFAAVAFALHVVINQKYISHLAVMCFYLYTIIAPRYITAHNC